MKKGADDPKKCIPLIKCLEGPAAACGVSVGTLKKSSSEKENHWFFYLKQDVVLRQQNVKKKEKNLSL